MHTKIARRGEFQKLKGNWKLGHPKRVQEKYRTWKRRHPWSVNTNRRRGSKRNLTAEEKIGEYDRMQRDGQK